MTNQILEHLRSKFTTTAVGEVAQTLNENQVSTQKAMDALLPAVTAGVINRSNQSDGLPLIYTLLNDAKFDTNNIGQLVETNEERRKAAEAGNEFMAKLHGGQINRLVDETAAYGGVKQVSASTMTGLTASVLMGFLRNQIRTKNMTESQLGTFLRGDMDGIREGIPAALGVAIAWLPTIGAARVMTTSVPVVPVTPVAPVTPVTNTTVRPADDDDRKGGGWWRWLLLALGLIGLFLLLTRMCNRDKTETAGVREETPAVVSTETVASDTDGNVGAPANGPEVRVGVDLPGGRKLNVAENSFNFSLAKFLATKGSKVPKIFTFDNLTFETTSARIPATARPNVDDLIEIMKAYPSLNIRIEGNTDSTGPEALNDPLSADRADAVKGELVKAGVAAGRITTRERGDSKPVASNQTEEGREKNRRIDVVVTKL